MAPTDAAQARHMRDGWRSSVEPWCSATILVSAAAILLSGAPIPGLWMVPYVFVVLAPVLLFWATMQTWRAPGAMNMARATTLALSLWAATAILLMLLAVPIGGKGPPGSGLRPEGSLDLFSTGTTLLAPLYGVLMLSSTALFWGRWTNTYRAIGLVGALLTLPYFMMFIEVFRELSFARSWRDLVGVALFPGTVLLIVAHARLWLDGGGEVPDTDPAVADTA